MSITQHAPVPAVAVAGNSPVVTDVPFWITACVRLMPPTNRHGTVVSATVANAVVVAAQALLADRLRGTDETDVPLDKARIARRCGLQPDKAGWLFDYLQTIGFLRITRHYSTPGRGRQHDTFTVYDRPPLNYVGPRSHAELEHALDHPDRLLAGILFVSETPGQPESAESGAVRNDHSAESGALVSETPGQPESAESGAVRNDHSAESGALVSETPGQPESAESGAVAAHAGAFPSSSFLPSLRSGRTGGREEEGPMEGAATPPALEGADDEPQPTAASMTFVSRLPWPAGSRPSRSEATRIALLVAHAVDAVGLSYAELHEHLAARIARARSNPIKYALCALSDANLPLPGLYDQEDRREAATANSGATTATGAPREVPTVLPACDRCGAGHGDGLGLRRIEHEDTNTISLCSCRQQAA